VCHVGKDLVTDANVVSVVTQSQSVLGVFAPNL